MATLCRIIDGEIKTSEFQRAIFVLDGEWADKDVARLFRSGWTDIVRLGDLEKTLCSIFKRAKRKPVPATKVIAIPDTGDDLPMAAEE